MLSGYSSADINAVCKEAAMEPIRELPAGDLLRLQNCNQIRKVSYSDFEKAVRTIRPSVSKQTIAEYEIWHKSTLNIV